MERKVIGINSSGSIRGERAALNFEKKVQRQRVKYIFFHSRFVKKPNFMSMRFI
jgi:hypothetical protein